MRSLFFNPVYALKESMSNIKTKLPIDEWVIATWDEYLQAIANPLKDSIFSPSAPKI